MACAACMGLLVSRSFVCDGIVVGIRLQNNCVLEESGRRASETEMEDVECGWRGRVVFVARLRTFAHVCARSHTSAHVGTRPHRTPPYVRTSAHVCTSLHDCTSAHVRSSARVCTSVCTGGVHQDKVMSCTCELKGNNSALLAVCTSTCSCQCGAKTMPHALRKVPDRGGPTFDADNWNGRVYTRPRSVRSRRAVQGRTAECAPDLPAQQG